MGYLAMLTAAFLWSIAVVTFKSVSEELSPFLINSLKNTLALFFFVILFYFLEFTFWYSDLSFKEYSIIIISGILGMGIGDSLFVYSLSRIKANQVAIIDTFAPVMNYVLSFFILGTILSLSQTLGSIIVIVAILFVTYESRIDKNQKQTDTKGVIFQILATLVSCLGIVILKPVLNQVGDSIEAQLWITAFRLIPGVLIAWIIFFYQKNSLQLLLRFNNEILVKKMIFGTFVGTFLALSFWIIGYANIDQPPIASIIGQSAVIFITIFSSIFLNEKITKIKVGSIFLAIIGVIIIVT
tara:strand:- start:3502 stop:4395 length:894 start_codon:yes stop_codon:yes gene_type:complete